MAVPWINETAAIIIRNDSLDHILFPAGELTSPDSWTEQ